MANVLFNEVLHPQFRMYYISHHKQPQEWINKTLSLTQEIWLADYIPVPISESPPAPPSPILAPSIACSHSKKSCVDFNIVLDYGPSMVQGPDALDEYLNAPPLPQETDLTDYWLNQWKAGEAMVNPSKTALAQMALDYLLVPGCSFIFSFTGNLFFISWPHL